MTVIRVSKAPSKGASGGGAQPTIPQEPNRRGAGTDVTANGHAPPTGAQPPEPPPLDEVLATFRAYIKTGVFAGTGNFHITLIIPFEDVQRALPLMDKPGTTFVWTAGRRARSQVYEDPWVTEDEG